MIPCPKDRTINVTFLEAPIDEVWHAIATTEGTNSYLTDKAETTGLPTNPRAGDKYTLYYGDITNRTLVTQCEPLQVFSLSDSYESMNPDGSIQPFLVKTHFTLQQEEEFVKLTLEVTGFSQDTFGQWFRECLEMGWRRSLMNLKSVLELGMDLRTKLFSYPRLGVTNCTVNEEQSVKTGVPTARGNYLLEVFPNSPADFGGLKQGDVIIAFDGKEVLNYREFVRTLSSYDSKPGQVTVSYLRNGEKSDTVINLSIDNMFTGQIDLTQTDHEQEQQRRKLLSSERSASGDIWKVKNNVTLKK